MELLKILSVVLNEAGFATISKEFFKDFTRYVGRSSDMKNVLNDIKSSTRTSQTPEEIEKNEISIRKLQKEIAKKLIESVISKLAIEAPPNIKYQASEDFKLKYNRMPSDERFGEGMIMGVTGEVFVISPKNTKSSSINGVLSISINFPKGNPPIITIEPDKTYITYIAEDGEKSSLWGMPPGSKETLPKYSKGIKDVDTDYRKGTEGELTAMRTRKKFVPIKGPKEKAPVKSSDLFYSGDPSFTKMAKSAIVVPEKNKKKIEDFANRFDWDAEVFNLYQTGARNAEDRAYLILDKVANVAEFNKLVKYDDIDVDDEPITKTKEGEKYTKYVVTRGPVTVKIVLDNITNAIVLKDPKYKPEVYIKGVKANK